MHRRGRTWNIPLGIGLFGAAVLVGGAILAIPETTRAPSHVDVSDPIASKPFPSFPEETHPTIPGSQLSDESATQPHEPLPAPTAIGGGPTRPSGGDRDEAPPRATPAPTPTPLPPPPATPMPAPTTATPSPATPPAPAESAEPPPAAAATDAGVAPPPGAADGGVTDATFSFNPETGTLSTPYGPTPYDPNVPYVYPAFPPTTAGTVVSSGGVTAPAGFAAGGTGGGVTTTKQSLRAPLMLPMSDSPDRFWTTVSPYLKSGDAVVANATNESSSLLSFADRVRTDAPLVTYIVAFATTAQLESAVSTGLPATLDVVGLSSSAGVSDDALSSAATKVHDNGKRMFLALNVPTDGPSIATVATSADVVELVVAGANGTELAANAKSVATSLGAKMRIYVRLPASMASPSAAPTAADAIVAAIPNAGVSLPASVAEDINNYRSR